MRTPRLVQMLLHADQVRGRVVGMTALAARSFKSA